MTDANDLRAAEAELLRRKAQHDVEPLARAAELLTGIAAACDELGRLGQQILTPYVEPHLIALKLDRDRAHMAVVTAERALETVLNEAAV